MTIQIRNGSIDTNISRRGFVAGAAGMTFAFTLGGIGHGGEALGATQPTKFNAWVSIAPDNTISIVCPAAEMGQGVYTSLPLILAEELDADWSKVKTEFAPANPKVYGNPHASVSRCADHCRKRIGARLFHAVAHGRRAGAQGSARCGCREVESAGRRTDDRQEHDHPQEVGPQDQLRRSRGVCHRSGGAAEDQRSRSEKAGPVQVDRPQGHRPQRRAVEGQRHGEVRHRCAGARHGLCVGASGADGRREIEGREHSRCDESEGRDQSHSASFRRGGDRRFRRSHARGRAGAQGYVGHKRCHGRKLRLG